MPSTLAPSPVDYLRLSTGIDPRIIPDFIRLVERFDVLNIDSGVRAAVYARISQDSEQKGLGVLRQIEDCFQLLRRKKWSLAVLYVENDTSATRKKGKLPTRPVFDALEGDLRDGHLDAVVGWEADRLFRDPLEQEQYILLCERLGVNKVATVADEIDISTGEGLMVWRIKTAVAAEETRKLSKRQKRKQLELAEAGRPKGGKRPYGFEPDQITHRPAETAIIRECADRVLLGESLRSIVTDLNARGVPATNGGPWGATALKNILSAPRMAGLRISQRGTPQEEVFPAVWDPILSNETHTRVVTALRRRDNPGSGQPARTYLLSGLLFCSLCGARLSARGQTTKKGTYQRRYHCYVDRGGCNKVGIDAEKTEHFIEAAVREYLETSVILHLERTATPAPPNTAVDSLAVQIASDEQELEALMEDRLAGRMTREMWTTATDRVNARLSDRRRRLAAATEASERGDIASIVRRRSEISTGWDLYQLEQKRDVIRSIFERIVIQPAVLGKPWDKTRIRAVPWPDLLTAAATG